MVMFIFTHTIPAFAFTLTCKQETRSEGDITKEFFVTSIVHDNETLMNLCLRHAQDFRTEELEQKNILAQQYFLPPFSHAALR